MSHRVKILFEFDGGKLGSKEVESMWAIPTENGFSIDNIPFYAQELALGDVIAASPDADGMLRFDRLVVTSNHSTVRLWFDEGSVDQVPRIRQELRDLGCSSELSNLPRLVAVDIPPTVPYVHIRNVLDRYEQAGLVEYEESCLVGGTPSACS